MHPTSGAIGRLQAIFIVSSAGLPPQRMLEVPAKAGRGLTGDRYAEGAGYYSRHDPCEVTLIEEEALERMKSLFDVNVQAGEHRRNLVTRGLALRQLINCRLHIGDVVIEYERPRPPCAYVARLTEPGMTRALGLGSGIGARVIVSGLLQEGAEIRVEPIAGARPPVYLP